MANSSEWSEYSQTLKAVSRSFYLSIKFLPSAMRETIALGYLLARLTDTIADSGNIEPNRRLEHLQELQHCLAIDGSSEVSSLDLRQLADATPHQGEKTLLSLAPEIFAWFDRCSEIDQALVSGVLATILRGQIWDLEFFNQSHDGREVKVASEAQLLDYTYNVAGCVGEFWTEVAYHKLGERFAAESDKNQLLLDGRSLGEGLQLINIIRDLYEDLPNGRGYLPHTLDDPTPGIEHWLAHCTANLQRGREYIKKVRNRRVRFATAMPCLLAEETVNAIRQAGSATVMTQKIKVPRSSVLKCAIQSTWFV